MFGTSLSIGTDTSLTNSWAVAFGAQSCQLVGRYYRAIIDYLINK